MGAASSTGRRLDSNGNGANGWQRSARGGLEHAQRAPETGTLSYDAAPAGELQDEMELLTDEQIRINALPITPEEFEDLRTFNKGEFKNVAFTLAGKGITADRVKDLGKQYPYGYDNVPFIASMGTLPDEDIAKWVTAKKRLSRDMSWTTVREAADCGATPEEFSQFVSDSRLNPSRAAQYLKYNQTANSPLSARQASEYGNDYSPRSVATLVEAGVPGRAAKEMVNSVKTLGAKSVIKLHEAGIARGSDLDKWVHLAGASDDFRRNLSHSPSAAEMNEAIGVAKVVKAMRAGISPEQVETLRAAKWSPTPEWVEQANARAAR